MATGFIILLAIIGIVAFLALRGAQGNRREFADTIADARAAIERLGGQLSDLTGTNGAAKQALSDGAERFNAASAQISEAKSPAQARLTKQTAIEGLYYIRAARTAMDMEPGTHIPELSGQRAAGTVSEDRRVHVEGRQLQVSPDPSPSTPNYYPGGMVAGRPVPAGWYSEPWWKTALVGGAWGVGSLVLFDALFSGMHGVGYDPEIFADPHQDAIEKDLEDKASIDDNGDNNGGFSFLDGVSSWDSDGY